MADDSQAFLFNVEKWFASVSAQRMSFSEKGVYLVMMFQQWRAKERSLPDNAAEVAELIAVTPDQTAEVEAAWLVVRRKFMTSTHTPGRIYNAEIENTRKKQRAYYKSKVVAGQRGGQTRARNLRQAKQLNTVANVALLHSAQAQSSSAQAHPRELYRTELSRTEPIREVKASGGVMEGQLPRDHITHVVCGRACLQSKQMVRFAQHLGGDFEIAKGRVKTWAKEITEAWLRPPLDETAIGENDFAFWDARFAEWQPSTGKTKAVEQDTAFTAALKRGPSVRR
jgi:uncharacterized protein YdaU (DUF1376 family)